MSDQLWAVFQYKEELEQPVEFQGIFDTEDKAIAACLTWRFCIMPVTLNKSLPEETIINKKVYYPIIRTT